MRASDQQVHFIYFQELAKLNSYAALVKESVVGRTLKTCRSRMDYSGKFSFTTYFTTSEM